MYKKGLLLTLFLIPTYSALAQLSDFQVNSELTGTNQVQATFVISEDGEKIYYTTGPDFIEGRQLFVADIDSPGTSVLLNRSASTQNSSILFGSESPSGSRVSFISSFLPRLGYLVDTDGSNELLVSSLSSIAFKAPEFGSSDDLIFYSDTLPNTNNNVDALYKNDLSTNDGPVRLDTQANNAMGLDFGFISTEGAEYIVYLAGTHLYSVSVDGGSPIRLDENGVTGFFPFGEENYKVSPDGERVIYRSTNPSTGARNLYSVSITGENRVLLDTETPAGESVGQIAFTPDSQNVVYITPSGVLNSLKQLYVAPIDGSTSPILLSGNLGPTGDVLGFFIGPRSQRVVYSATDASFTDFTYYSVLLDGSVAATQVSPKSRGLRRAEFSKDGEYLSFVASSLDTPSTELLYVSNLISGNSREVLNSNGFDSVDEYEFSNLSDFLIFSASADSKFHLYAQPLTNAMPVRISRELVDPDLPGPGIGTRGVTRFQIAESGNRLVYSGTITRPSAPDLFSVDLSGLEIDSEDDQLCVPIKTKAGKVSLVCI